METLKRSFEQSKLPDSDSSDGDIQQLIEERLGDMESNSSSEEDIMSQVEARLDFFVKMELPLLVQSHLNEKVEKQQLKPTETYTNPFDAHFRGHLGYRKKLNVVNLR